MKLLIALLLTLYLPTISQAQLDCPKFKNGRFIYPTQKDVVSERKNNIQKSISKGKVIAIWKVDWIDDCSYTLTCKKLKAPMEPFQKGDVLKCKIIGIQDECINVQIIYERDGMLMMPEMTGEMCLE